MVFVILENNVSFAPTEGAIFYTRPVTFYVFPNFVENFVKPGRAFHQYRVVPPGRGTRTKIGLAVDVSVSDTAKGICW